MAFKFKSFSGDDMEGVNGNTQTAPMLPAARLLVEAFGLMTRQIPATGPKGHLLKGDVLKYIEENKVPKLNLQAVKQEASGVRKKPMQPDAKNVIKNVEGMWKFSFFYGNVKHKMKCIILGDS